MAKPFALKFYKSKAWQQCRAAYIKFVFGICEGCGGPGLIVHHKTELTPENINDPEITLGWQNLELLCLECHNKEHGNAEEVVRDGLKFDERGDLVGT
ncbi:MAG: HNH endonuclease [Candidatus Syntrophopropionicum ammoniitolerans]